MTHYSKPLDMTTGRILCGSEHLSSVIERGCGSRVADPRWFVFQTHSQSENWAQANLVRQGYEVYVPRETVLRRDPVLKTMTNKVEVCCFPGYGFVRFCPNTDTWRPIVSTRGIKKLFCTSSERPMPVRHGDVERLIEQEESRRVVSAELPPFAPGEELVVTAGPFADRQGICHSSSESRTRLLMQVRGAEVVVEVARGAVRAK